MLVGDARRRRVLPDCFPIWPSLYSLGMGRASRRAFRPQHASSGSSVPSSDRTLPLRSAPRRVPVLDALLRRASAAPATDADRAALREVLDALPVRPVPTLAEPEREVVHRYGVDVPVPQSLRRQRSLGVVLLAPRAGRTPDRMTDVRRLVVRAREWGYGRLEVRWLFGLSVTCGTELASFADPIGPGTDAALDELAASSVIVAAWGDDAALLEGVFWDRCWIVGRRLERLACRPLQCIGFTEDGYPASPSQLSVRYQKLQPFTVEHFTYPPGLRGTARAPDRPRPCA